MGTQSETAPKKATSALPKVKATILRSAGGRARSNVLLDEEAWGYGTAGTSTLPPPLEPTRLAEYVEQDGNLAPCIDVMATNIDGMGHTFEPARIPDEGNTAQVKAAADELAMLTDFFEYATPDMPHVEWRKRLRKDKESIGWRGYEVLRDGSGKPCGFAHVPAHLFRLTPEDPEVVEATFWRQDAATGEWRQDSYPRRFRRFVQIVGGKRRYFKALGDPRDCDKNTGKFFPVGVSAPEDVRATEMVYACNYFPGTPYGLPRYIGHRVGIESAIQVDGKTLDYLSNGAIPKLLIALLGGSWTKSSAKVLEEAFANAAAGGASSNRGVILEAAPIDIGESVPGGQSVAQRIGLHVEKLGDLQQGDSLFREFRKDHREDIRQSFRFGGIFLGRSDDANFATANIAMQMGESQVFAPERAPFDWEMNHLILPELNAKFYRYRSKGPTLEDNATWIEALRLALEYGVVPDYKTASAIFSEQLGVDLKVSEEEYALIPPGFVKVLFAAIGGFPGVADLQGATDGVAPGTDVRRSVERGARPSRTDADVSRLVEVLARTREALAARAG